MSNTDFNPEILERLSVSCIERDKGLLTLFILTNKLRVTVPQEDLASLVVDGLIEKRNDAYELIYPLYKKAEAPTSAFDWVEKEYIPLFSNVNPTRGGHVRDCISRMKKFFSENPAIRVDDVLLGTMRYLRETDRNYIREARYFISKGIGSQKTSDLLHWVSVVKQEEAEEKTITRAQNNIMN